MHPFYANVPPPTAPHMHDLAAPPNQSSLTFDEMIKQRYTDSDNKVRNAISRTRFPDPEAKQECLHFVSILRIHKVRILNILDVHNYRPTPTKHLFMHTYVHLVSCCNGRYLHMLVEAANIWKGWGSVQQLTHHSLIKDKLHSFWEHQFPCHQHKFLLDQRLTISDDDSDFLSHLLYCGRKPELYKLPNNQVIGGHDLTESEQVIELLWQLLMKRQEIEVTRRLRALIYRMARKSAYLPHALQITRPSISNRRALASGANGSVTKATMDGRDVVIKKILCGDRAAQRKCLEMFTSEAILWKTLDHKNIVPFLGVVAEGTFNMGLVSPFFINGNIRSRIRAYDPKDWPALAWRWARDLAEGLEYIHCHEPPIIHGDLKGDNVLVDDAGRARLGDFGQSHASDSGKYLDSTRVGLPANPLNWMAPEIMLDDSTKASDLSDIYSFGCVLYEMLSGKVPFEGLVGVNLLKYVSRGGRPHRPESIRTDDRLWKIANSCWENRPENRPSATRLISLLS